MHVTGVDGKVEDMDATEKKRIESFAWNCTVGAGVDPDECSNEPDEDAQRALSTFLGRALTGEDIDVLVRAWRRCLQEIAQP